MARLDAALPPIWSRANPVDIAGDADAARYAAALELLLDDRRERRHAGDECADGARVARDAAKSVVAVTRAPAGKRVAAKPVFAVWIGGERSSVRGLRGRRHPATTRPNSSAVAGFMHLVRYREARDLP